MSDDAAKIVRELFAAENRGDPLASFPSLVRHGQPYNIWLTGEVLDQILARWLMRPHPGFELAGALEDDVSRGSQCARAAFKEILPAAVAAGDPAVLAAMGVTANLQRTLGILGEHLRKGGRLVAGPPAKPDPVFRLSRLWCGLVEYPEKSPYFAARIRPPVHPGRLQPRRRDPRHLANALWCSLAAINERCDQTIAVLREEIVRSGLYTPDDIRRLRAPGAPSRPRKLDDHSAG